MTPVSRLLVLPGTCDAFGGTLVSASLLIQGFLTLDASHEIVVLVRAGSLMDSYMTRQGQRESIQAIAAPTQADFVSRSLQWVSRQPKSSALLLDNCVARDVIFRLGRQAVQLRLGRRRVFHFFHDLALSRNRVGGLVRSFVFKVLRPYGLANSHFTASHVRRLCPIRGVVYQPVDMDRFRPQPASAGPAALAAIRASGARIILTASRLTRPGIMNDKNLRALPLVVAALRKRGAEYHAVLIGEDASPGQAHSAELTALAQKAGVNGHFTILPPVIDVENYYRASDIVLTLAPREPCGRTVLEALACGVPVVGSNTGGIAEMLNHFAPAWTANPDDPDEVAKTILDLESTANRPTILRAAVLWLEKHCSLRQFTAELMKHISFA